MCFSLLVITKRDVLGVVNVKIDVVAVIRNELDEWKMREERRKKLSELVEISKS